MNITLTWQSIVFTASVIAATTAIITAFAKIVRWVDKQKQQDGELESIRQMHHDDMDVVKKEQTLMVYGLLACLKGLKEQGCNGPVTEAINKIEKHLNEKAHE